MTSYKVWNYCGTRWRRPETGSTKSTLFETVTSPY